MCFWLKNVVVPLLPLALIALESQGMMKDRVYGITQTIYHAPYYMRHVVSPARVTDHQGGVICAQANYVVFRTRPGGVSEVYNVAATSTNWCGLTGT